MRFFIHIVSDTERIEDPEGAEFVDVEAATTEAVQSARDLMARELMEGRPVSLGWRVEVATGDGTIVLAVPFAQLAFSPPGGQASAGGSLPAMSRAEVMAGAIAIQQRTDQANRDLRHGLGELWAQLRALSQMNAALGSR